MLRDWIRREPASVSWAASSSLGPHGREALFHRLGSRASGTNVPKLELGNEKSMLFDRSDSWAPSWSLGTRSIGTLTGSTVPNTQRQ